MGTQQHDGEWWLPESPDHVVPGTLTISDSGEIELRLFDSLRSEFYGLEPEIAEDGSTEYRVTTESIAARSKYPRILGRFNSSGCTLDDCFTVHRAMNLAGGKSAERIYVQRMFSNVHFVEDKDLWFSEIVVHMDGLVHWTVLSGLKESMQYRERKNKPIKVLGHTLEIKPVPTKTFPGPNSAKFQLAHTYRIRGDAVTERALSRTSTSQQTMAAWSTSTNC